MAPIQARKDGSRHGHHGRIHHMVLRNQVSDRGDGQGQNSDSSGSQVLTVPKKVPKKQIQINLKTKPVKRNEKQMIVNGRIMKNVKAKVVASVKTKRQAIQKRRPTKSMKVKRDWKMDDFGKLRKIGQGGFGKVFKTYSIATEEICALKFVSLRKLKQYGQTVEDIFLESWIQGRVNHRNVLKAWGNFIHKSNFIFVMDFCPIGDLLRFIFNTDYKATPAADINRRAKDFTRQIVSAVAYVHSKLGFIHMDLKPQNVMMAGPDWVKITDFGCSVLMVAYRHVHPEEDLRGGTLPYFPPEVLLAKKVNFDSTVDVWSIGCIAYELLTKFRPFFPMEDRSANEVRDARIALRKMKKAFSTKKFHFGFYDKLPGNQEAHTFFRNVFVPRVQRPLARTLDQLSWLN